ncbi:MAG: hypothetical protein ACI4HO_03200 [Ruminococcus sp.]
MKIYPDNYNAGKRVKMLMLKKQLKPSELLKIQISVNNGNKNGRRHLYVACHSSYSY